ncbi:hypothetical protein IMSAG185_00035 [Lachnospiraceae bacterium]|nr:hypothetical protein IMSAG185_00035 [Lachnospiraceae bacterium]
MKKEKSEFKTGTHIIAVLLLSAVQRPDLRLGVPSVIQIRVGLGQNKGFQPPAVCPHRRLDAVLLKHSAALQKLLRCLRQFQLIPVEHILIDKQSVGDYFLGDGHQLPVYGVRRLYHIPQILYAFQPRQILKPSLFSKGSDRIRIQQVEIIHIVSHPVKGNVVVGLILIALSRIGNIIYRHPKRFLRHTDRLIRGAAGHILRIRIHLFHGAVKIYNPVFALIC